ncbi:sce7726 family protein [Rhizobium leguminosarum]|uniref:sce7726 family protein n=1 Tax=Rhizobium leguminosarum TaxID=384 RepID=UPI001A9278E7|nr:sce7726 family protein [Rhizobium leguminosarum]MBY5552627.1 sce7726 family protein [Rhizobium leguminosarum]MBY5689169.1 sce7726 family protein [Rhizobium leguminosarum]MBY5724406.1 sce7726 family protein [Rhizobium leguminosarum]MBY5743686.1 sce7726 family protein [Rhizobium leguminosarum]QSW25909.1 sce7726 family protein [Rhizobium leguminosarum]
MTEVEIVSTTDAYIRAPLLKWLRSLHPDRLTAKMLEEFKMPRPSARIDVALVNGEMAGFEIKSDRDTLTRLASQVPAFSRFFDRVSLVTTQKHLAEAKTKIPNWWGIVVFCDDGRFKIARTSKRNRSVDVTAFLFALSKRELMSIARRAGITLPSTAKKDTVVDLLATSLLKSDIRSLAREAIKSRSGCL